MVTCLVKQKIQEQISVEQAMIPVAYSDYLQSVLGLRRIGLFCKE